RQLGEVVVALVHVGGHVAHRLVHGPVGEEAERVHVEAARGRARRLQVRAERRGRDHAHPLGGDDDLQRQEGAQRDAQAEEGLAQRHVEDGRGAARLRVREDGHLRGPHRRRGVRAPDAGRVEGHELRARGRPREARALARALHKVPRGDGRGHHLVR
ncbi:hypothetical protein EG866_15730, partial [Enterococcus faecalis]